MGDNDSQELVNEYVINDVLKYLFSFLVSILSNLPSYIVGIYLIKWTLAGYIEFITDPMKAQKRAAKSKVDGKLKCLGIEYDRRLKLELTEYEMMIADHLVDPTSIPVSWSDIAGLEGVIQQLRETVILPIQKKELFANSQLTQPPKGVLLHGPPGCGKTMIAKAIANEARTRFLNLDISMLTEKWFGESEKLTAAVFTLAVKLQPCIVFVDEIDSFLRKRNSFDHEVTAKMKAQFMSLWDGLITDPNSAVILMGATNRPKDLDRAIFRRMPARIYIGLPDITQREQILRLILDKEPIAEDVDLSRMAKLTENFSGSDLRELCRSASLYRVRDYMKVESCKGGNAGPSTLSDLLPDVLRPISMDDLLVSVNKMKESKSHTDESTTKAKMPSETKSESDIDSIRRC